MSEQTKRLENQPANCVGQTEVDREERSRQMFMAEQALALSRAADAQERMAKALEQLADCVVPSPGGSYIWVRGIE